MRYLKRVALAAATLAMAMVLGACGDQDTATTGPDAGSPPAASGDAVSETHNAADVEFAQMMIPHHRQAIEMTEFAPDRAQSEEVKVLAEEINAAQTPEIETMISFLETWGEEVPEEDDGSINMGGMSGMLTPQQMMQLEDARDAQFDRIFLQLMTEHHIGAVEMAQTEKVDGENLQALALAEQIETTQMQEIERMRQLLQSL